MAKPGGGYFLSDPHHGGKATRLELREIAWGRLVDVHDVDEQGNPSPIPVLRDVVIGESVQSDGTGLELELSPITHEPRLIVRRPRDAPDTGTGTFASTLGKATELASPVLSKHDDGSAPLPISFVARNATIVLLFSDLLEDGPEMRERLVEAVRLTIGYPPVTPQSARIVFDPSHGGIADGEFHSTRVLVDFTVSEREALALPGHVPVNAAGMPAGSSVSLEPNGSLHVPARIDAESGRFVRLTNLAGRGLEIEGPSDPNTGDLVRAFRSGNATEPNAGYMLDLEQPSIVGSWEISVTGADDDPLGPAGYGFLAEIVFTTQCRSAPRVGDTLEVGGELYEVREPATVPDGEGRVHDVRILRRELEALASAQQMLGLGTLQTPYRPDGMLRPACWVNFAPRAPRPPDVDLDSDVRIRVRFSEPMDPATFRAFDTFRVLRGTADVAQLLADDLVVGAVHVGQDLQEFSFSPRLPLDNQSGLEYRFELVGGPLGVRDLTGTPLLDSFDRAAFRLSDSQAPHANNGFALRFDSRDELAPPGDDVHGQVTYDPLGGILRPRPAIAAQYSADSGNVIPNLMFPFASGVQTPLSPLGSKLQAIWRYCDFNFHVRDENLYNLDVIGLAWSPVRGRLNSDFYPLFELRLSHARHLPDESFSSSLGPKYPDSGLLGRPQEFRTNVLEDPRGGQVVVHSRGFGYVVQQSDLSLNPRGTPLVPFPWNRTNAPFTSYTWRDTSLLSRGGPRCPGVPLDIEVGPPALFDTGQGLVAAPAEVPSIALPLLWEVRCFPSSQGLGLNSFDILLPVLGWAQPNFRVFSTGGVNHIGQAVLIDPDLELRPRGGFNPNSSPPGLPTPLTADNSFYVGAIETVIRVSRAVTVWIDSGSITPRYVEPVIEPRGQIGTTSIVVEYRGADAFSEDAGVAPFDAARLNAYGDFRVGTVTYHGDGTWSEDIQSADGARFLQVRFTFVNDIMNALSPELDSFGLAFEY